MSSLKYAWQNSAFNVFAFLHIESKLLANNPRWKCPGFKSNFSNNRTPFEKLQGNTPQPVLWNAILSCSLWNGGIQVCRESAFNDVQETLGTSLRAYPATQSLTWVILKLVLVFIFPWGERGVSSSCHGGLRKMQFGVSAFEDTQAKAFLWRIYWLSVEEGALECVLLDTWPSSAGF